MTASLNEDVVLEISSPQLLTVDTAVPRGGVHAGSVELGRRLLLAARHGDTAQVLELMGKGAPFTTDWLGTSTLHLAASGAHVGTCAVLLRAGVSRDARTKVERTPLHVAAHAGHVAVASLLLEHGALVDCRDMLRMTPLHWAAARGHAQAAAVLLRHGADPLAVSKFHKTPRALAAASHRLDIVNMMDDALKEREAAKSVDALALADAEDQMKEITAAEQQRALESIERLQEAVKPSQKQRPADAEPIKIDIEIPPLEEVRQSGCGLGGRSADSGQQRAAQLLQKHGITLLPQDDTSTVLNAIQSGRTVVLSDAGKLMLAESGSPPAPVPPVPPAPAPPTSGSKGVILTAAPVKSPPKPGVKIFTLNNTLLAMPKETKQPIKKVINPHDMQIKFVSLDKLSPSKVSMKAKSRLRPSPSPAARGGGSRPSAAAGSGRPAVKIIMNKANFNKMLAGKVAVDNGINENINTMTTSTGLGKAVQGNLAASACPDAAAGGGSGGSNGGSSGGSSGGNSGGSSSGYLCIPQEFLSSNSPQYLRTQLLSAHQTIRDLNNQLDNYKQRLAKYENV